MVVRHMPAVRTRNPPAASRVNLAKRAKYEFNHLEIRKHTRLFPPLGNTGHLADCGDAVTPTPPGLPFVIPEPR